METGTLFLVNLATPYRISFMVRSPKWRQTLTVHLPAGRCIFRKKMNVGPERLHLSAVRGQRFAGHVEFHAIIDPFLEPADLILTGSNCG